MLTTDADNDVYVCAHNTMSSPNHLLLRCQMTMLAHQRSLPPPPSPPHCQSPQKLLCVHVHYPVSMYTVCRHITSYLYRHVSLHKRIPHLVHFFFTKFLMGSSVWPAQILLHWYSPAQHFILLTDYTRITQICVTGKLPPNAIHADLRQLR